MRKLRGASTVRKRVHPTPSAERVRSSRIPCFYDSGAGAVSKFSPFPRSLFLYTRGLPSLKFSVGGPFGATKLSPFSNPINVHPPKIVAFSCGHGGFRLFSTESNVLNLQSGLHVTPVVTAARAALMDYLHCTRSFQFADAEHISQNSPIFLNNLLQKVKDRQDVGRSITRFLLFHPINEFEPFFESLGLVPSEINQYLPRDLMFLSDDDVLLDNYYTLVNYGIPRLRIGKIFKEATGIFCCDHGILGSKLQAYEELGLTKTCVIRVISSSPSLLIGNVNRDFVKVLEELESMGIDREWIGGNLSEENSCHWGRMLMLLQFFREFGFSRQEVGMLVRKHPGFLLESSGKMVFSMIGLLAKLGGTKDELLYLFSQFPSVQLGSFVDNLRFSLQFMIKIEMDPVDIQKVVRSHPHVLGSCYLKTPYSVLSSLSIGKKRLCRIIKEDPHQFRKWVLGKKIKRLPSCRADQALCTQKEKFLLNLGFVDNSEEMKKAFATFRGKPDELQDRYDCFVNAGLDPNVVPNMIRMSPHILNQTRGVLESKIDFLVNGLGYPLDSLVTFPSCMSYTIERVKLRFLMYDWLKDEGKAKPNFALSTILACSEKVFFERFVNQHTKGPEVWEKFKRAVYLS
uniref:mTERF domain-containing protein 1, mitochondrial n=1 Tax=Anthurium amnicola TaxID=1678845 RepID=A0A1D1YHJ9_9ARAE